METFIIAAIIGLLPAYIAKNKGYSFFGWWIYGSLLFIVALPHVLLKKTDQQEIDRQNLESGMKKCPYCAEIIRGEAQICKHCNHDVSSVAASSIYKICSYCNQKNRKEDYKCIHCGKELIV